MKLKKIALLFTIVCVGQLYGMDPQNITDLPRDIHYNIIKTALETSKNLDEAVSIIEKLSALQGIHYKLNKSYNLKGIIELLARVLANNEKTDYETKLKEILSKIGANLIKRFYKEKLKEIRQFDSLEKQQEEYTKILKETKEIREMASNRGANLGIIWQVIRLDEIISDVEILKKGQALKDFTAYIHRIASDYGETTAYLAQKFYEISDFPIEFKSIANKYFQWGNSLIWNIKNNILSDVQELIEIGADVNFIDEEGNTPLSIAKLIKNKEIIEILRNAGAQ